jgi:hypothetical protein
MRRQVWQGYDSNDDDISYDRDLMPERQPGGIELSDALHWGERLILEGSFISKTVLPKWRS